MKVEKAKLYQNQWERAKLIIKLNFTESIQISRVFILEFLLFFGAYFVDYQKDSCLENPILTFRMISIALTLLSYDFLYNYINQLRLLKLWKNVIRGFKVLIFFFLVLIFATNIVGSSVKVIITTIIQMCHICYSYNIVYSTFPLFYRGQLVLIVICLSVTPAICSIGNLNLGSVQSYPGAFLLLGFYALMTGLVYYIYKKQDITTFPITTKENLQDYQYDIQNQSEESIKIIKRWRQISKGFLFVIIFLNTNLYSLGQPFTSGLNIIAVIALFLLMLLVIQFTILLIPTEDVINMLIIGNIILFVLSLFQNTKTPWVSFLIYSASNSLLLPTLISSYFRKFTGFIKHNRWIKYSLGFYVISILIQKNIFTLVGLFDNGFIQTFEAKKISTIIMTVQNVLSLICLQLFEYFLKRFLPQSYQKNIVALQI